MSSQVEANLKIQNPRRESAFDQKCWELADFFLPETAPSDDRRELAAMIQQTIEDYLSHQTYEEDNSQFGVGA